MSYKKKILSIYLLFVFCCINWSILNVNSSSGQTIKVENLADLLNYIPSIEIKITDYEGFDGAFGYEVVGEETINDIPTWKVESKFGESGEEETYTIWAAKSDGVIQQAEIEGEMFTGTIASMLGNATFSFWMVP